jgi:hypothetical protein
VEEKEADCLFTVKGNQKTLLSDVEDHFKLESFSLKRDLIECDFAVSLSEQLFLLTHPEALCNN